MILFLGVILAATEAGTRAAQFLKIPFGARAASMAEAFTGVAEDISAVHFNPANLNGIKNEFLAMKAQWFQGIDYMNLAFAKGFDFGTLGVSVINLSIPDIEKRNEAEALEGTFNAQDASYQITYSDKRGALSRGITAKYIRSQIDDKIAQTYTFDIGFAYPVKELNMAVAIRNIGGSLQFVDVADALPLVYAAGGSYRLKEFLFSLDVVKPVDSDFYFASGLEYARTIGALGVALRAGYRTGLTTASFAFGAGLKYKQFGFDFSFVPYGVLGNTFRYALTASF